ncbi:MAG: PQQ-like beta-propeller repeat protein [Anaerolineaceae bacterium]|nr:PQQ-like beta-propeller repeat protein [Anaerolineaceae bacterium]
MLLFSVLLMASLLVSACGVMPNKSWPGLAADENTVYVTSDGQLLAVKEGAQIWRFPEKVNQNRLIMSAPAVGGGKVFVGDSANNVYAIDAATGAQSWINEEQDGKGRIVGGLAVVDGTLLIPSTDHFLYARDLNGTLKWKFEARNTLWTQPVSDGKTVYLASLDHYLYAIDLATGTLQWELDLGNALLAVPALNGNNLYVGTLGSEMVAVEKATGKVLWRSVVEGSVWSKPLLVEDTLFFGTEAGKVYAMNTTDGVVKWQMDAGGAALGTPVVFGEGMVITTESGEVNMYTLEGGRPWSRQLNGKLYSSPVVVNERVVVAGLETDTLLATFEASGTPSWTFNPAK